MVWNCGSHNGLCDISLLSSLAGIPHGNFYRQTGACGYWEEKPAFMHLNDLWYSWLLWNVFYLYVCYYCSIFTDFQSKKSEFFFFSPQPVKFSREFGLELKLYSSLRTKLLWNWKNIMPGPHQLEYAEKKNVVNDPDV